MHLTIGMLGLGNVGTGFANLLYHPLMIGRLAQSEISISIKVALVRSLEKKRQPFPIRLTTNPQEMIDDPEVNVVIETMGGVKPASDLLLQALAAGKHVISSNKAAIAAAYPELIEAAAKSKVHLLFEASVGGGVPIIRSLIENAFGIRSLKAVVNGTTNFILEAMEQGREFSEALAEAQKLGFAEPNPQDDIDGTDVAYKLSILAAVGFGTYVQPSKIYHRGIERITSKEIQEGLELGHRFKLIALAVQDAKLTLKVEPELVPVESFLGQLSGVQNGFIIDNGMYEYSLSGEGAGALPTGCSIMDDLLWLAHRIAC